MENFKSLCTNQIDKSVRCCKYTFTSTYIGRYTRGERVIDLEMPVYLTLKKNIVWWFCRVFFVIIYVPGPPALPVNVFSHSVFSVWHQVTSRRYINWKALNYFEVIFYQIHVSYKNDKNGSFQQRELTFNINLGA